MKLSEHEHDLLRHLSDGNRHNLFAWPLVGIHEFETDHLGSLKTIWAAAWLCARRLADVEEEGEDKFWLSITPGGRAALENGDA